MNSKLFVPCLVLLLTTCLLVLTPVYSAISIQGSDIGSYDESYTKEIDINNHRNTFYFLLTLQRISIFILYVLSILSPGIIFLVFSLKWVHANPDDKLLLKRKKWKYIGWAITFIILGIALYYLAQYLPILYLKQISFTE